MGRAEQLIRVLCCKYSSYVLKPCMGWPWDHHGTVWYIDTASTILSRCEIEILGVICDVPAGPAVAG